MLDLNHGSIHVDGIDISKVARHHVRSHLNIIPQEPFFLHGTVRLNIDPEFQSSDQEVIDALRSVQLWNYIESRGGLDVEMSDELLSHGQQQLFCLARALCKPSSIVIVDEATSRYATYDQVLTLH
jgi:ATP-binding cassette subfamily C (CFTR/MRP) protein 1